MPTDDAIPPAAPEAPAALEVPGPAPATLAGEPEAWAAVQAAWEDEAAHRAYLSRFADLDGLAVAGGRYRAALEARPADPLAARFRDEIVRRATVQGLASLPRSAPREPSPLRRRLVLGAVLVSGVLAAWAAARLAITLGGGAP